MEDVKVCRICLVMDVEMLDLQSYPTNTYFEPLLAGTNLLNIVNSQPYACKECTDLVKKFYFLKKKFLKSQAVLFQLLDHDGKVAASQIKQIDHQDLSLNLEPTVFNSNESNYSKPKVFNSNESKFSEPTVLNSNEDEIPPEYIKQEIDIPNLSPAESVKEEHFDLLGLYYNTNSSDDDEPLALHRKMKIGNSKDGLEREAAVETELTEHKKEPESISPPKRKRGRPKKFNTTKKKFSKKGKTENGTPFRESLSDFGEHITISTLTLEEQLEEINKRKESTNYLNSPYQCNLCYKGFIDTKAWTHHVGKHSPAAGDIECPVCKFRFKTRRMLQKHQSNHEKKYSCKSCTYVSSNMTQAKQHQGWHKGVTYKCKHCDEMFTIWTSYMSHVRIKHPSEFICGICGYSYISKLGLTMHKTMMHKDILAKGEAVLENGPYCEECDVKFVSMEAYKRHMVMSTKHTRSTKTIPGCRTCGETFKDEEELRLHHRKEHARKRPKNYGKKPTNTNFPAKCEHCEELIPNAREHWAHYRRSHPDKEYPIQKNYVCDVCGKSFRGNAFLVYHKRTHTEERAYKCNQCDKAFFNRTNLKVHQKIHNDTRPYPCSVCFKAFKCKGALTRHFRSHTGHKPYSCEVCGKSFTQSNSRKLHVFTVHLKQPAPYVSRRRNKHDKEPNDNNHFVY